MNPVTGKKQVSFLSEAQEKNIGKQNDPAILAQFGLYQDKGLQDFINQKGQEMVKISHRPTLDFEFKVLDSPVINAFALPGGYVYFTRGIMAHFNNEAQFAGVLGHEIGHVTARHSAEQYTKQTIGQILLIGGLIISPEFRTFANEAQQGLGLLFLKFSRGNESESDVLGVDYSSQIGYNAHEMAEFFNTLDRSMSNSETGRIPEFLSTHPDPGKRFETVHALADEWQQENGKTNMKENRNSYLKMIDGMIYGEDPAQGYVDNNVFYHPELKFQFPFPNDWKLVNSPIQVQMAPADGKAMTIFTLSQKKTIQEAKAEIVEQFKLEVQRDLNMKIGGFPAYGMVSDQVSQDQSGQSKTIAVQTILIDYDGMIYVFHGLCEKNEFNKYEQYFDFIMTNFKKLTDPARLNVRPEIINVVAARKSGTLQQALSDYNVSSKRLEEMAILNGMQLTDQIKTGDLIKIVKKKAS
jgi:predicted Zn-dependent protease